MTTVVVGGDVCPTGRNLNAFCDGNASELFGSILPDIERADFTIVNLECPLVEQGGPIVKDGVALEAPTECVNGIRSAGIDAVNLANNHILDQGADGLKSTIEACENVGVDHVGAGANLREAGKVLVREVNGIRIGVLGVAEHEFSIAGERSYGANPLDIIENVREIRKTRRDWDFLIVLIHGGREGYQYPSPGLQKTCRFFVEEGAGAVVVQHTHIAGCFERYRGAPIVYGQGNLLFDAFRPSDPSWHEGFLVQLDINDKGDCAASWIPYIQSLDLNGAERMRGQAAVEFLGGLDRRSEEIIEDGTVQSKWSEYCRREKYTYASRIRGHNRFLRVLNRKVHFSDWFYSRTTKLIQRNVVECEIHREALETLWRDDETEF